MTDILMSAGEMSGDRLGGALAAALLQKRPDLTVAGIGGEMMRRAGVEIVADFAPLSVMGYWDAARRLPQILSLRRRFIAEINRRRPKLFIGIDAPDFNLGVAAHARAAGAKTAQYVGPSVWMWRAGRVHKVARAVDEVWCLFPFEPPCYKNSGVRATFVGHPEAANAPPDKYAARRALQIADGEKFVAMMPGSRPAELRRHLPLFAAVMRRLQKKGRRFAAIAADDAAAADMRLALKGAEIYTAPAGEILPAADAALIKSGTSALQAALSLAPMVVVYKMSAPEYLIARARHFSLPFFSLPNILSGRFVAPEMIQTEATPQAVAAQINFLLEDERRRTVQVAAWSEIRGRLLADGGAAAANAAQAML